MKSLKLSLIALLFSFACSAQIAALSGPTDICIGTTGTYSDATPGGTWTISPTIVATISTGGVATGISVGTATITYTVGASYVTYPITVNPLPAGIVGPSTVCVGSSITLTDGTIGGTWASSNPAIATIGPATGIVTGTSSGIATIIYTIASGCSVSRLITVNLLPATISGPSSVCAGSTITLSSAGGGTWTTACPTIIAIGSSSGVATGVAAGACTVSYTLATGCSVTDVVTVNPLPTAYTVTGGGIYCTGGTGVHVGISGSTSGVSYQLVNGATMVGAPMAGTGASLDFGLQTVAGTYTVIASNPATGCATTMTGSVTVSISPLPTVYTVAGGGSYCAGGAGVTITLSGSQVGVSYQLYNGVTAIGAPVAGTGASISFGPITASGTYTISAASGLSCATAMSSSVTITINPLPNAYAVTGGGPICSGGAGTGIGLSNSDASVSYQLWLSGTPVGAPALGSGSSISFGTYSSAGVYTVVGTDLATGCSNNMSGSATITVGSAPTLYSTTGGGSYCAGGAGVNVGLSNSDAGVMYQLYNGATMVGSPIAGTSLALSFGSQTAAGTYTVAGTDVTSGCSANMTGSAIITINALPTVTASASAPACGGAVTLTAGGAVTYSWAPSTGLSCSTCTSPTTTPTASVTYTVTGTDASGCTNTASASVSGNDISGHIIYVGGVSTDVFKVWLIQFNPSDSSIVAEDSVNSCMDGTVPYFEFMSPAAGNYLVKASMNGTVPGTSGYIPTYGASTPNWYAATNIAHTSSADIQDITMVYGTVPSGPGFIAGYVYSGAGRGTSGDVPAVGMLIYLKDATGNIITYTYTDAAGQYAFNSIANGSYIIYPEDYKYYSTPSSVITLSPGNEIAGSINFKRHTTFGTITPNTNSLATVSGALSLAYYPNPTSGILNINLGTHTAGTATVTLTNVTGSLVYTTSMDISSKQQQAQLDLSGLENGMYFISFRSDDLNLTGKVLIVK